MCVQLGENGSQNLSPFPVNGLGEGSMKNLIKKALSAAGLEVKRSRSAGPVDFSEECIEPLSAYYRSGANSFFIRVPLEYCRHMEIMSFRCDVESGSPYVQTILDYMSGRCVSYSGSYLERFYAKFQPKSAAERMGIENPSFEELAIIPPCGAILPWSRSSPWEESRKWRSVVARENRDNGFTKGYEAGDKTFGPTTREKGELEFRRLIGAYESIAERGYVKNSVGSSNIHAVMLLHGVSQEVRFYCAAGHHRLAAMTALGHRYVDMYIRKTICGRVFRREEVGFWPSVQSGYLSHEEALLVFDRMFYGEPPAAFIRSMGKCIPAQQLVFARP